MPARPTQAALIARVRDLIGDSNNEFSSDQIAAALDRRRLDYSYVRLWPETTILPGGAIEYRTFFAADGGDWEDDAAVVDSLWYPLVPASVDYASGRWTFDPAILDGVVYVSGKRFDVYGAAADMCEQWMGKVKQDYSFSRGGRSYQRNQKIEGIKSLRDELRRHQWIGQGLLVRTDVG